MPVRQYVNVNDTLTAEQLTELASQQLLVFADHASRDAATTAIPERRLAIASFGPAIPITETSGVYEGTIQPITIDGTTYNLTIINRMGELRIRTTNSTPEKVRIIREYLSEQGAWFRYFPATGVTGPTAEAPLNTNDPGVTGDATNIFLFDTKFYLFLQPAANYHWEIYIPSIPHPIRRAVVCITLNDNKWWIWNSETWIALTTPPARIDFLNLPRIHTNPPRSLGWERAPIAVHGRRLWLGHHSGIFQTPDAAGRVWPFSTSPSANPVLYLDGWTHIIEGTSRFTATADVTVQVYGVARGGAGQGFTPPGNKDPSTPHTFGAAGGGAGGRVERVVHIKKGQSVTVHGADGVFIVDGARLIDPPDGGAGDTVAPTIGFGGGGAAKNRSQDGADPDETPQPVYTLPITGLVTSGQGTSGNGNITSPGAYTARGGDGGGDSDILRWTPGGIKIGGGGTGGSHSRAGAAGDGYGGGGGGSGGGRADDVRPGIPTVSYTIQTRTRGSGLSLSISADNADQVRYRTHFSTQEQGNVGVPTDSQFGSWSPWRTPPFTQTLYVANQYKTVVVQAQSRKTQTDGRVLARDNGIGEYIEVEGSEPGPLSVRFTTSGNPVNTLFVRFDATQVLWRNSGSDVNDTNGVRFQWRYTQTAWDDDHWIPAEVGDSPRYDRLRIHQIVVPSQALQIEVRAQVSNVNGQSTPMVFTWVRPDAPEPGEPTEPPPTPTPDPDPPAVPSVTITYNEGRGRTTAVWDADRASEYRYRWTTTDRQAVERSFPGAAPDYWSAWGRVQQIDSDIGPTIGQIRVEVQARNQKNSDQTYQVSSTGSASRSFAAPPVTPPPPDPDSGETPPPPPPTIVPPSVPNIRFTSFRNNRLAVSWTSTRADATRWRYRRTTTTGTVTSAWSSWSTTARSTTLTLASSVSVVRFEVQARNGTSPNYNLASGFATWRRPTSRPEKPTVRISNVVRTGLTSLAFRVNITSNGAEAYQYRILRGSVEVRGWSDYSTFSVYNVALTTSDISITSNVTLTVEARARNTAGVSDVGRETWNTFGTVGAPAIVFGTPTTRPLLQILPVTWSATNAQEYQYAIADSSGRYSNYSAWYTATGAEIPIVTGTNEVSIRVRARFSSGFSYREGTGTWTRPRRETPTGPMVDPPSSLRVSLTLTRTQWQAQWSAMGTGIRYSYVLSHTTSDGRTVTRNRVNAGSSLNASGPLPRGATQISITVTAANQSGQPVSATASRNVAGAPTIVSASVTSYSNNRLSRGARLILRTTNATGVRYFIRGLPSGTAIPGAYRRQVAYAAPNVGGTTSWNIPLFYTGSGTATILFEARNSVGETSRTVIQAMTAPSFAPPSINFSSNAYQIIDPRGALPIVSAGIVGLLLGGVGLLATGGAVVAGSTVGGLGAGAVSGVGAGVSGGTLWAGGTVAGLAAGGGSIGVGGIGLTLVTTGLGASVAFTAGGLAVLAGSAAAVSLSSRLQGSPQRNLRINAAPRNAASIRSRIGWRISGGFSDVYTGWSSWQSAASNNTWLYRNIAGGDGLLAMEYQARGPDGATTTALGFNFTGPPIDRGATRSGRTVTIRGTGATRIRARLSQVVSDPSRAIPQRINGPWQTKNTSKSGRTGTATFTGTIGTFGMGVEYQLFSSGGNSVSVPFTITRTTSSQQEAPPPVKYVYAPPPFDTAEQATSFAGGARRLGVVVLRHSDYGKEFVEL